MGKKDRKRILDDVKKNKVGRTLREIEELLALYGFLRRSASKEASVWNRGGVGLCLPNPKSGTLLVDYVVLAIRKIREAEEGNVPEETIS